MKQGLAATALATGMLMLQACGTTSGLKPMDAVEQADLSGYERVVVLDFADHTDTSRIRNPAALQRHTERVQIAGRTFADVLASEIRQTGAFTEVLREPTNEPALVITGAIARYQEGSAVARALIGMGAGSSYFDASIRLADESGRDLGLITTDQNSWVLGGAIAAGQTVETFMRSAARKAAAELQAAKQGPPEA